MNKAKLLRIVNLLLPLNFLLIVTTAVFHESIRYELYEKIHALPGFIFTLLVITHIILNFNWIKKTYLSKH